MTVAHPYAITKHQRCDQTSFRQAITHLVRVLRVHEYFLIFFEPRINLVETDLQPAFEVAVLEQLRGAGRATVVDYDVVCVGLGITAGVLEVDLVDVVDGDVVEWVEDMLPATK